MLNIARPVIIKEITSTTVELNKPGIINKMIILFNSNRYKADITMAMDKIHTMKNKKVNCNTFII